MGNYPSDFEIETSRAALGVGSKQPFLRMKNLFCSASAAVEYEVMGQSVKSFSTSQSLFVCYVLSNMQNWCPSGVLSFVFSICCMDAIQKKQLLPLPAFLLVPVPGSLLSFCENRGKNSN